MSSGRRWFWGSLSGSWAPVWPPVPSSLYGTIPGRWDKCLLASDGGLMINQTQTKAQLVSQ